MLSNKINFFCPNCSSDKYIGKTTIGKNYKDELYKNVVQYCDTKPENTDYDEKCESSAEEHYKIVKK